MKRLIMQLKTDLFKRFKWTRKMKKTNTIFTKLHADLLRFISKSLPNKTSRYDAFMYLLENQIELINQYKNGSNAPRHYTILGLSNKWKWDRKTVMSFLKSLQDIDVISVKGDVSGITIRVLHLVPDHDIPDRFWVLEPQNMEISSSPKTSYMRLAWGVEFFLRGSLIPQKSNFGRGKGCGKRASSPPLGLKRHDDIGNRGTIKLTNLRF